MAKFSIKGNFYNNAFHLPATTGPLAVENIIKRFCPADLSLLLTEIPVDYRDVDKVVESAIVGFKTWKKRSPLERISFLKSYQHEVSKRSEDIALAIAYETGRPLAQAQMEVSTVIKDIGAILNMAPTRVRPLVIENAASETHGHIYYKPVGPSLVISPSSFPSQQVNAQMISTLLAGNSVVLKPSEKAAYSAQLLMECFYFAELPSGVVNLLQGDGEVARRLVKEKAIKCVFFTGSKEVGKKILDITHNDLSKLVSLELGGKNTSIIHHDANLEQSLYQLLKASFLTAGQSCTSTSLVAIHRRIHEKFMAQFHNIAKKIIIDHPVEFAKAPFMGPLIDQAAVDSYLLFMGMAKREGIDEIMRGKQIERAKKGHYVTPSVHFVDNWKNDSLFLHSQIFGPNVTFIPYDDEEEAISIANATEFGLSSAVYTKDQNFFTKCLEEIDSGIINHNHSTLCVSPKLPFGGVKNSGNYRPAGITTIDACVYQLASLEGSASTNEDTKSLVGLDL